MKLDSSDGATFSNFHIEKEDQAEAQAVAESSEDEEPSVPEPSLATKVAHAIVYKETSKEQLDWLNISERDI